MKSSEVLSFRDAGRHTGSKKGFPFDIHVCNLDIVIQGNLSKFSKISEHHFHIA